MNANAWPMTAAARDVLAERQRQIDAESYTTTHDDEHDGGELAAAGAAYAIHAADVLHPMSQGDGHYDVGQGSAPVSWPWGLQFWKPKGSGVNQAGARQDLVRAAALMLAEIERFDRASSKNE